MTGKPLGDVTLAVLGAGRIGQAIIKATRHCVSRVIATGRRRETLEAAGRLGAEATRDNAWAARQADLIVVSVKPYQLPAVALEIRGAVEGKVVASIVAGVKLSTLRQAFPGAEVYRAMPNINALIARSTTALASEGNGRGPRASMVEALFKCLGSVYWIPEEWMDAWTALVGSGPAFIAEIVDALVLGAVMTGMPRDLAYRALLDALKATAEHLEERPTHPLELRDEVTTPAGTTIYGLAKLEASGVKAGLMSVVEASTRRGAQLGESIDKAVREALEKGLGSRRG
ncbi:pyrroline-5-carboxylate reductase [Stetteria hydrogenophila]